VDALSSGALWTELVRSDERIAALYFEANEYAEEIETLCIQIAKSARAKGDLELLDVVERINREVSDAMIENAKTFGLSRDIPPTKRTARRELIEDALDASKRVQESMKTSRERLLVLREKLKLLVVENQPHPPHTQ